MRSQSLLFSLCTTLLLTASVALAQQRNFVACPIVRDTRTVPCYLAEYDGETYFLGVQHDSPGDFDPPQLKHEVLVEGAVKPGPRVCGGIPLQPVSISVMTEVNLACNTLLPAEPGIEAPVASHSSEAEDAPTGKGDFTVLYAFDDDLLNYRGERVVTEAAAHAKQIGAKSVKVSGYRSTSLLSNGQRMTEKPGLAEKRAQDIATVLRGLGVSAVTVDWKAEAEQGDGKTDPSHRRVTIAVMP